MAANAVQVAVMGAAGRMGKEVIAALDEDATTQLGSAIVLAEEPVCGQPVPGSDVRYSSLEEADCSSCQVLIAFTTPEAIAASIACAKENGIALVLGTTGETEKDKKDLDELATEVPVLAASNMSLGTNVLFHLSKVASQMLPHWDVEIFDIHHRDKVDAPSGTAVTLGKIVREARNKDDQVCNDRTQRLEARPDNEIGMAVMRAGDVVGEHTVLLAGTGERLELTHRAMARSNFAKGAVHAAKFLVGKAPGRYQMSDVLGLPA